jgi:SAM-dependent methyltransferase
MKKLLALACVLIGFQLNGSELPFTDHPYGLVATDDRFDELCKNLQMPPVSSTGLVQTMNHGGGFMLIHLDSVSSQFVDFASRSSYPVLDIGSAYGAATIPVLKNSTCPVIADDIGVDNLLILRKETEEADRDRLYLNSKRFPQELDFPSNSLSAVLICRVFHFMRGEEIEEGLKKVFQWLVPGGKLFVVTSTQYQGVIKDFIPVYEERWASGVSWPGYIEDFGPKDPVLAHNFKPFLHVMDIRPLRKALEAAGFEIEQVHIIDRRKTVPTLSLDGREGVGVIAVKPRHN